MQTNANDSQIIPGFLRAGTRPAQYAFWNDGNLTIMQGDMRIVLPTHETKRLADFLLNCVLSNEVNA